MKKFLLPLLFLSGAFLAQAQSVQTSCPASGTTTSPTICLTWTNSAMASAITPATGTETAGPGTAEIWYCVGASACTSATFPPSTSDTPPSGSAWTLAGSVPQTTSAGTAALSGLTYGALYQVAVRNTWNGVSGFGAFSSLGTNSVTSTTGFSIPAAPPVITLPGAPSTPSGTITIPNATVTITVTGTTAQ